jgi:hypothetical protein
MSKLVGGAPIVLFQRKIFSRIALAKLLKKKVLDHLGVDVAELTNGIMGPTLNGKVIGCEYLPM